MAGILSNIKSILGSEPVGIFSAIPINLCKLLNVKKNIVEKTQVSLDFLQIISREFPEINYKKTEELVREIKEKLKIKRVDRPKEIVVGAAIYLAHKNLTQTKANEIIKKFSKCKPINFTRISNFLQLSKSYN